MFVLNCLFELIFKSRTKNRTERGCLKQPFCRFKYTMVPSAQNGTAYHNPSSAVVLLYLCLSYVLYVSVSVHCIHRIQHCTSVFCEYKQTHGTDGTREKKHTTEKELLEKHFHTMCDFPILSSMSGLFMYMCSVYTEAKIHETNRIFHLVRSFSYSLLPLCCFFSTLSLFLPLTLIRTDMQCHSMVVCVCWFHFDRNDSNEKWKPLCELDVSATVAFGVYSVFFCSLWFIFPWLAVCFDYFAMYLIKLPWKGIIDNRKRIWKIEEME